jgi:hypothetical protein
MEDMALDDTFKKYGVSNPCDNYRLFFPAATTSARGAVNWVGYVDTIYEPKGSDDRYLSDKIMPIWKFLNAYSILIAGDTILVCGILFVIGGEKSRNKNITACLLCV